MDALIAAVAVLLFTLIVIALHLAIVAAVSLPVWWLLGVLHAPLHTPALTYFQTCAACSLLMLLAVFIRGPIVSFKRSR